MPRETKKLLNGPTWTAEQKRRVKTLYLVKGWTASEIAGEVGKEARQVTNLVNHRGWAKRRREIEEKAARAAEEVAITDAKELMEAAAVRSEESMHNGFDLADGAAKAGDALAFSAAMSGTKTAFGMARTALGIDATHAPVTITLNAVYGSPSDEPRPAEKVGPDAIATGGSDELEFA